MKNFNIAIVLADCSSILEEIQKACAAVNANCHLIQYEELDCGDNKTTETLHSADVAIIDVSIDERKNSLFYHLGVRESVLQEQSVLLMKDGTEESKFMFNVKYDSSKFPLRSYPIIRYSENSGQLQSNLTEYLQEAQIQCKSHLKDKILGDLLRARENIEDFRSAEIYYWTKDQLCDPNYVSPQILYQLLFGLRELQDFDSIVEIVENGSVPAALLDLPEIMYFYAFALIRCNREGNRDKAIKTITKIVENSQTNISDLFCLLGRIYKDIFTESGNKDDISLQQAINWYRKGFESQPNLYAGINLATLLVVSGKRFSESEELTQIGMTINNLLGRKGSLTSIQDYWDLATYLEINVLTENYSKAAEAAELIFKLHPRQWYVKSTMKNIQMIRDSRKSSQAELKDDEKMFLFWISFFSESTKGYMEEGRDRKIPVLISEFAKEYSSCYLTVSTERNIIHLSNSALQFINKQKLQKAQHNWIFSPDRIKSMSLLKRDNRALYIQLRETADDLHIYFPSDQYRDYFYNVIGSIRSGS